jgi:Ner family transcriptional regulator
MTFSQPIPSDPEARDAWIAYQLRLAGSSFARIADELGIARQTVRVAIERPYPKIERIIAKKIGLSPEELWPERYARRARRRRSDRGAA